MVERHEQSTAAGMTAGREATEEAAVPRATETDRVAPGADQGATGATPDAVRGVVGRRGYDEAEDATQTEDERH
jgi:hypothetical protein